MKRITKIEIQNFQSHKSTVIEPTPGLTVIVGHTDSGKSAFIRALRWCLYNKQPKSQLINKDSDFASVKITFSDNSSILRYKSKNKKDNYYIVVDKDGKESTYTSVGNTPLKEVMDVSGMYEVNMFNRDLSLNMTDQFDSLFFLAENPTDKGTLISQMANTEVCDAAIAICSAKINGTKKLITTMQKALKVKKESLSEYNYLEELKNVLDNLGVKKQHIQNGEKLYESIKLSQNECDSFVSTIKNISGMIINIDDIISCEQKTENLSSKIKGREVLASCSNFALDIDKIAECLFVLNAVNTEDFVKTEERLNALVASIQAQQKFIMIQSEILNNLSRLSLCALPISVDDVDGIMNKVSSITQHQSVISAIKNIQKERETLIGNLHSIQKEIDECTAEEANIKTQYKDALAEGEICPVCGNIMDEEHLNHSVDNL